LLFVDDEPALCEISRLFLENLGDFRVTTANSALEGLGLLEREPFDAIISDYQMPGMDGIAFLKAVRERYEEIPFILFTGRGREEVVIQAIKHGVDYYVQKGGDPKSQFAELRHMVRTAIERRAAERAFRASELRYRTLIQQSSDVIRIIDADGRIAYESDSSQRLLGYPPGFTLGRSPFEFIHPDDRTTVRQALNEVFERRNRGVPTPFRIRKADGEYIAVEATATNLLGVEGVDGIVVATRPVEDRRRVEEALRESRARLALALEGGELGTWDWNPATGVVGYNDRWREIAGYGPGEVPGDDAWDRLIHPDDRPAVQRAFVEHLEGRRPVYEAEYRLLAANGEVRWVFDKGKVLERDEGGTPLRVAGTVLDITEHRRMEEALRQANRKLNLLSALTRHDIINLLLALAGYISLLGERPERPAYDTYVRKLADGVDRISAVIRFTKTYEQIGVETPAWQNLRKLVGEAVDEAAPGPVRIENDVPAGTEIFADPLVVRVFVNLIDNAVRHGGAVTGIRFSLEERGEDRVVVCEDDGRGVPVEEKERIFDRGYGRNTGLGLFLSREILEITGIAIRETGEPGRGARFECVVPKEKVRMDAKEG
jgi:PAS domain S-box-containing protein